MAIVRCLLWLFLASAVFAFGAAAQPVDDDLDGLNRRVLQLLNVANYKEALPLARRALALAKRLHGPDHPFVAACLNNLAELNRSLGNFADAEPLYRRALAINEKSHGAAHPDVAINLNNLALLLQATNRPAEAEALYRRALAINEKRFGPEHPSVALGLNNLANLLQNTNRPAAAEPLMRRSLAIDEKSFGPNHPNVAMRLNNLGSLLHATNRSADAEPLYRRALAISEKSLGREHPDVANRLNNLGNLLQNTNRLAEAEPLYRRALAINEKRFGPEHPDVALGLNNLATLLKDSNRLVEAELLHRRALYINEKRFGPEHPKVSLSLNNLAILLEYINRPADAEPLYRRALAISEKSLGREHPEVANRLNNLAHLLMETKRFAEAEPLMRRALTIDEKSLGSDHPNVAGHLSNLANLLREANRLAEAEPLMRRALAIREKHLGPSHPKVAVSLNNLAELLQATNRRVDAEPLYRRALVIDEKSFGPLHPIVAVRLNNLALLRAERGDWAEAVALRRRAKPILIARRDRGGRDAIGLSMTALALHRVDIKSASTREEGFEVAQWALQTSAAEALAQMSVRFAKGAGPLARLVRERQDLVSRRQGEDKRFLAAVGNADTRATSELRIAIAGLDKSLEGIDKRLSADFPEYQSLADPKPLTIAVVQSLLRADETLVLFLDVPRIGQLPEETLAWAVTKTEARWLSIPLGTEALNERVAKLRCGLDRESHWSWSGQRWLAKSERCRTLAPLGLRADEPLPFDLGGAHELYAQLLEPFSDLTHSKSLIIVPSGPLTILPFHVLVTEAPQSVTFQNAAWLALKQSITMLPSVGSLQALRRLPPSEAKEPYIAFGNPLLDGSGSTADENRADQARAKQTCPQEPEILRRPVATAAKRIPSLASIFRGGGVNLTALRAQMPLPETADELCAVAMALGALRAEQDTVWLGARATESNLKALSGQGKLARHRVLHFATHGLLAGETQTILGTKAEPALILTPPKEDSTLAELEQDDGLLTGSEVAQLELDADWVVLSACNTAAGDNGDAEALSGFARAFFYAKARALLVSHWYVNSEAAVKLTTVAFSELSTNPTIGRAEALRRSMEKLITGGGTEDAHPSNWAPFVLVGEGAR